MNQEIKQLLDRIYERPGMCLGKPSLNELVTFACGYIDCMSFRDGVIPKSPFSDSMSSIVLDYYNVKDVDAFCLRNWIDIILFFEHSEKEAFYKFNELLELYEKKYSSEEESDS